MRTGMTKSKAITLLWTSAHTCHIIYSYNSPVKEVLLALFKTRKRRIRFNKGLLTGKRQSCLISNLICWADVSVVPFKVIIHTKRFVLMTTTQSVWVNSSVYLQAPDNMSATSFSLTSSDHPFVSSGFSAQILIKPQVSGFQTFFN